MFGCTLLNDLFINLLIILISTAFRKWMGLAGGGGARVGLAYFALLMLALEPINPEKLSFLYEKSALRLTLFWLVPIRNKISDSYRYEKRHISENDTYKKVHPDFL